ncbi:hypothetical protein MMC30_005500 [Trapelia coarctata]|nr:hypothetical protein [Trapelia coarctata]
MSNILEPPFNEFEERYLLAEILKKSTVPPTALLQFIRNTSVEPAWTEIALPTGAYQTSHFQSEFTSVITQVQLTRHPAFNYQSQIRRSVSACQNAFQLLSQRTYDRTHDTPPFIFQQDPKARRPKRPFPTDETTTTPTERMIQPRPVTFASVNGPGQISPSADDGKPKKKRGRPSKEEHDRRVAEAAAKGEVYPRPRKPKTPRQSMEGQGVETVEVVGGGAPTAIMFTPNKTIVAPPTSPSATKQKHVLDTTTSEGTALPAGQVLQEGQRAGEPAASGQHPIALGPRETPMTGLRQLAAMPESRDVQMGDSEHVPSPGPVPVHTGYSSTQGNPYAGYQTHENPTQHHPQMHEPQRHEQHRQPSQTRQVHMPDAPAQDPNVARMAEEQQQQRFPDPGGNVS